MENGPAALKLGAELDDGVLLWTWSEAEKEKGKAAGASIQLCQLHCNQML